MKIKGLIVAILLSPITAQAQSATPVLFPANGATNINPDTPLTLTFDSPPIIGETGRVRIYDASDNSLVDTLDLSIPSSPNPTGRVVRPESSDENAVARAPRPGEVSVKSDVYQVTQIGGTEFHFFPIIVNGNTARLYPHNGKLTYGRTYIVRIDPEVLKTTSGALEEFDAETGWRFTTKASPPSADATKLTVSADGTGDFSTVQGAIDFLPPAPAVRVTVSIRNGDYQELVFMNGKSNVTLRGESRDGVRVHYPNNSAFNPPRGGPSRRPAFTIFNSTDVQLSNFTILNDFIGQAEALLINGTRNIVDHMTLIGSGDALTLRGSVFITDSSLTGDGDTCLCYGPAFFLRTEIRSKGPFTWTRNPKENHGNIFVDSTFIAIDEPLPWTVKPDGTGGYIASKVLARLPRNGPAGAPGANFPHAEMVLINARLDGVPPEGWGPVQDEPEFDRTNVRLWEYNSVDLEGKPIDVSRRHPVSRQLTLQNDAETIANYSRPEYVLDGWTPVLNE